MTFSSEAEKDAFKLRVDSARRILFPYESTSQRPDNAALLNAMLDIVLSIQSTTPSTTQSTHSFLDTAGIYTGDEDKDDQRLCVVEHKAIRLIHAFTCAGMLPSQFINFCKFAEIGVVSNKYIHSVYIHRQYQQIVADSAEESMNAAVQRVKANPEYVTSGEWVITDARHDSSANAYHSTVPSRGLNVTEVAYDYQSTVKTYVEQLGKVNSYDTWHARSTIVHLYWCMKNCASNPDIACNTIMIISQHFQGHHLNCHLESRCRQPGYHPKRKILTMCEAIKAYEDALKRTLSTALLGHSVVYAALCSGTN
ncbi:hypothetical protein EMCRGX_G004425 [Ephydatia muelleri]